MIVPASFISDSKINCFAPARLDPGVVNLKVTNNGIDFADEAVDFEYVNLPSISKIQPERGPIGVPIQVTIHGSGFMKAVHGVALVLAPP